MKHVMITGADRGIGFALCRCFLEGGWQVFAGRYMEDWTELDELKRFRWFCAEEDAGGMSAGAYLLGGLCYDEKEPYLHSDENRLVMRDSRFREIAW